MEQGRLPAGGREGAAQCRMWALLGSRGLLEEPPGWELLNAELRAASTHCSLLG